MPRLLCLALVAFALSLAAPEAHAQQFVHQFKNPAFGGSPLNYQWMLSSAQAQNPYQQQARSGLQRDPFQDFQQSLQRQVLNQLSREIIFNRFGDLDLSQPGRFDFGDFSLEVIPGLGEINIRIINLLTGDESIITIPNL